MRYLSRCYEAKGEKEEAKIWLFRAIAECPDVREPYFYMVQLGYRQKEWPLVYAMVEKGLAITQRSGSYLVQPECWGEQLYDYGAISAFHMELYDKALDYERKACEISPDNERLKTNLKFISQKIAELSAEEVH